MKVAEFIQAIAPKIGPNATFDLMRDARISALENLLIAKEVFTRAELDFQNELELAKSAQNIDKMAKAPGSPFRQQ